MAADRPVNKLTPNMTTYMVANLIMAMDSMKSCNQKSASQYNAVLRRAKHENAICRRLFFFTGSVHFIAKQVWRQSGRQQ
ncbi:MAG: hypothetical protein VX738_04500 [Planctomycetota bacterium]|nr:hypothetical protein [Planctomycetota bacterium]